jgi:hypothetical protein
MINASKMTSAQKRLIHRLYHRYTYHDCTTGYLEWKPNVPAVIKRMWQEYMDTTILNPKVSFLK